MVLTGTLSQSRTNANEWILEKRTAVSSLDGLAHGPTYSSPQLVHVLQYQDRSADPEGIETDLPPAVPAVHPHTRQKTTPQTALFVSEHNYYLRGCMYYCS